MTKNLPAHRSPAWTAAHDDELRRRYREGQSAERMALALGRTTAAVATRLWRLRLRRPRPKRTPRPPARGRVRLLVGDRVLYQQSLGEWREGRIVGLDGQAALVEAAGRLWRRPLSRLRHATEGEP